MNSHESFNMSEVVYHNINPDYFETGFISSINLCEQTHQNHVHAQEEKLVAVQCSINNAAAIAPLNPHRLGLGEHVCNQFWAFSVGECGSHSYY